MTAPQTDRANGIGRPFSERLAHSFPTARDLAAVVALCIAIASVGQAVQAHNADEFVFTGFAVGFVAVAAWFLRDGFNAGIWMFPAVALAAKDSGDSTGLWWVAIPSAVFVLVVLVLVDRHAHRASASVANDATLDPPPTR